MAPQLTVAPCLSRHINSNSTLRVGHAGFSPLACHKEAFFVYCELEVKVTFSSRAWREPDEPRARREENTPSTVAPLYLQRHLDEHQELLDADPDALPFELLRDASALLVCEASQQLRQKMERKRKNGFQLRLQKLNECVCQLLRPEVVGFKAVFVCVFMDAELSRASAR